MLSITFQSYLCIESRQLSEADGEKTNKQKHSKLNTSHGIFTTIKYAQISSKFVLALDGHHDRAAEEWGCPPSPLLYFTVGSYDCGRHCEKIPYGIKQ